MADLERGDVASARRRANAIIARTPDDAQAHFLSGRIARIERDFDAAVRASSRACDIAPDQTDYRAQLAQCLADAGERDAALDAADRALRADAGALALDMVAAAFARLGLHDRAAATLRRATTVGGTNPIIFFNLATQLKFCGDFVGARAALEQAIALAPDFVMARGALTLLRRAAPDDNQIAAYRRLMTGIADPQRRLQIGHALAHELDALGDHDGAFRALVDGKAAMLAATRYRFAEHQALFDAIAAAFAEPRAVRGHQGDHPIFVTGMPRSGTTVVDRILSAHPDVTSIGESLEVSHLLQRASQVRSTQLLDPAAIETLARADDLSQVGRTYLERIRPEGCTTRLLDKFHLNSLLTGFIVRALPDARVVCVMRGPMDTVASNFRQSFDYRTGLYRYNLTPESTAQFHIGFRRLAQLWATAFPQNVHIVHYEALVADPVAQGRRMFNFCGLSWDDRYVRIEENTAPVATASAVQVRQPISTRTIGQWRRYAAQLDRARQIIEAAGLTP